ncbi:MAG: cell surface protein, partial [Planctomycetes bacterium]|nr:cell surface protein [Planctomycetota bacterium]
MSDKPSTSTTAEPVESSPATTIRGLSVPTDIQKYLDRAVGVLKKFGVSSTKGTESELVKLLDEVKRVDEAKVVAIAKTLQHMSTFNALVRDNVESINIGNRYLDITQMFDSVRDDSKTLIKQLDDGKFSLSEKASNLWMRIRRGTPSARFEKIMELYKQVSADTKNQLVREQAIMDGYIDFRFALKEAEIL